jgi:RHS repeat-associated protein
MGKPAARMTDLTKKGGPIVQGSATVLIGDAGGKACSVCPGGMAVGSPVNPALGAKVLLGSDDLDFSFPGPLPLAWQRQYSSYVNETHGARCGLLGYGWTVPLEISVRLLQDSTLFFDTAGRVVTFTEALAPGAALHSVSEDLWIVRGGGGALPADQGQDPWARQKRWAHVPEAWRADADCVLLASGSARRAWLLRPAVSQAGPGKRYELERVLDEFGRLQRYDRDEHGRLTAVTDGAGRRYALLYNRPSSADEAARVQSGGTAAPGGASATAPVLQPDSGLRLVGVDCVENPHDPRHAGFAAGAFKPIPLVRYQFNAQGDLIEVIGRDGRRSRQFAYDSAHRLVAHRAGSGPVHEYVYEDQRASPAQAPRPGARVVEQHNQEGLSYFFTYLDASQPAPEEPIRPVLSQVQVKDSLNRSTQYHFEGGGGDKRLVRLVQPDGSVETHQYDGMGRRVASTDALGRVTRWRYDGAGRVLGVQHPGGGFTHQSWGAQDSANDGLVLTSTDINGLTTGYEYDEWGRLAEVTAGLGTDEASRTRFEYLQAPDGGAAAFPPAALAWCDRPIAWIDPQGGRKTMTYNACGQPASYTDCSGKTTRWLYDWQGRPAEISDAMGHRFSHEWDLLGRLAKTHRPDGTVLEYLRGDSDRIQAVTVGSALASAPEAAKSTTFTYAYDLWGRTVRQAQAGQGFTSRYDLAGRLTELINENSAVMRFSYDDRDRLVQEVGFDGRCQTYCYDAAGQLIGTTDSSSSDPAVAAVNELVHTRYYYDTAGHAVGRLAAKRSQAQAQLEINQFSFDGNRLTAGQSWSMESASSEQADLWLRLQTHQFQALLGRSPDPEIAALAAQLQTDLLQAGSRVELQRDGQGRVTGETQILFSAGDGAKPGDEPAVEFEHRIAHRLNALGQRESSHLNGLGQLDWLTYGTGHVHGLLFDSAPLVSFERDGLHQEVKRTLHLAQAGSDAIGAPPVQHSRRLDALGRPVEQQWQGMGVGDLSGAHGALSLRKYSYDALGQLASLQTPAQATRYRYDAQQRLVGLEQTDATGVRNQAWWLDAAGNRLPGRPHAPVPSPHGPAGLDGSWSNQVKRNLVDQEFNVLGRQDGAPAGEEAPADAVSWTGNRVECSVDAQGGATRYRHDVHGNRIWAAGVGGDPLFMRYDALHQLKQAWRVDAGGQRQATTSYRYDAFGRRLSKSHRPEGRQPVRTTYFGWDGDCLVHTEDTRDIHHTVYEPGGFVPMLQLHRRKGALGAARALSALSCDSAGEDRSSDGAAIFGASDDAHLAMVEDALADAMKDSSPWSQESLGPTMASLVADSLAQVQRVQRGSESEHPITIRHYLCDHLGTPLALVDANGRNTGEVTWAGSHGAWGDLQDEYNPQGIEQHIRFQGQQFDRETGLHYNRFRYYDPAVGAYTSRDPIGLAGGLNNFIYPSSPTTSVDPMGLNTVALGAGVGGAVAGPPGAVVGAVLGLVALGAIWVLASSSSNSTPSAPTAESLTDAHKAANGNRAAAGYGGNCTPDEHDDLKDKKEAACDKASGLTCGPGVINYGAADVVQGCIDARIKIARKCFMGGDKGHNDQINQLQRIVGKCMGRS